MADEFFQYVKYFFAKWVASCFIVFGGIVPYVPQYLEISKTGNSSGFSLYVCLTLIIANILRILFWFGKRFELPLLLQSILMIITMLALVKLCVRVRNRGGPIRSRDHSFLDFDIKYFWNWTDFQSYLDFILIFSVVGSAITYLFIESEHFIEGLGFLAVFIEALLGVPQLWQNYKNKTTQGMSVTMVIMWTIGDVMKTVYFLEREAPHQFVICGLLQIMIDVMIMLQIGLYGRRTVEIRRD